MPMTLAQLEAREAAVDARKARITTCEAQRPVILAQLYREYDLHKNGLLAGTIRPTIEFSSNLRCGGKCYHNGRIVLSWQAFLEYGWLTTLDTFRHEMAHLVHQNHSRDFWDLAKKLGVTHETAHSEPYPKLSKTTWRNAYSSLK